MDSKIHSIVNPSILAFALIATAGISTTAFVNVLAQEGAITPEGSINDTMSGENATQWANATLAFAQEGFTTEDLVNETIDLGNDTMMNATLAFAQENDTGMTSEGSGNMTGMTQGQTDDDDDGDDGGNDDGDSEEDKDEKE